MKTLEITEKNALKAFNQTDEKGKELLVNLFGTDKFVVKSKDRIETFEEALLAQDITEIDFLLSCKGLTTDEISYKKLKLIIKSLNKDWTPDWNNENEYKYYPYFNMSSGVGFSYSFYDIWYSGTIVGSRLCFKSRELAEYAGKQFEAIYKDFLTL